MTMTIVDQGLIRMPSPQLPPEILEHIFDFLPAPSSIAFQMDPDTPVFNCSQVSRPWRAVAYPRVWRKLVLPCVSYRLHTLDGLARFFGGSCTNHHDPASFVRTVEIKMETYCDHTNDLSKVVWRAIYILRFLSRTQLEELVIEPPAECMQRPRCHDTSALFTALAPMISQIKSLQISGVSQHKLVATHLLHQSIPLCIERLVIHDALEDLEFDGHDYSHDYDLDYDHDHDDHLETLPPDTPNPWDHILSLPNIQEFELSNATTLAASDLVLGIQIWGANLRRISLLSCPPLHDNSVVSTLAAHCPNLTSLSIGQCESPRSLVPVTDGTMCQLVDRCPRLEELFCVDLRRLTDKWLGHCAARAWALKSLRLVRCYGVTGKGVSNLAAWRRLETIAIGDAGAAVDQRFAKALVWECRALKVIFLAQRKIEVPRVSQGAVVE